MLGLNIVHLLNEEMAYAYHAKKRIECEKEMLKSMSDEDRVKYYKEQKEERRHQELCQAIKDSKTVIYNSIF